MITILSQQGCMLQRQRFPKGYDGLMWNWRDLNIGVEITVYKRTYHIYTCDTPTKVRTI